MWDTTRNGGSGETPSILNENTILEGTVIRHRYGTRLWKASFVETTAAAAGDDAGRTKLRIVLQVDDFATIW